MNKKELNDLLTFAVSILVRSGRISRKYFRSQVEVKNKSRKDFDPVTVADREVEVYLRNQISKKYPDHSIYGEEYGHSNGSDISWLIDPIDGTKGFISGSPMWGTLLGVKEKEIPLLGVMHQPFVRETFYADNTTTWWKSGTRVKKLRTASTGDPEKALLYCTHPAMFTSKKEMATFKKIESRVKTSRYGGDCYGYCLLASGFVDVVVEAGLKPYDIVPLIPIIESAGGVVTDWQGNLPVNGGKIIATANKKLHNKILSMVSA